MERVINWIDKLGIGRRIDELGTNLKRWSHIRKIIYTFLLVGAILWIILIPLAISTESEIRDYYGSLGVDYEYFSVEVPAHYLNDFPETITLEGIALYPIDAPKAPDQSVPAVLQINGANNRKERNHDMSIQLVRQGIAVFIIEQRGHGESEGRATFYGEEPGDVSHVLDYLAENYKWINSTHFGGLGFSLGAGCLLIAQALDSRLYACSLFHPPTDISGIFQQVDVSSITGSFLFQRPSYAPEDADPMEARTAFYWCDAQNTANVLMIQGDADTLVPPADTIRFFNSLDLHTRNDVQLIIRPDLDHEPNEADKTSRKYAIAWLLHFFGEAQMRASIDISNLDASLSEIELVPFTPPNRQILQTLAWAGMFVVEFGLLFYGILIGESSIPKNIARLKVFLGVKIRKRWPNFRFKPNIDAGVKQSESTDNNDAVLSRKQFPINSNDPHALFLQQIVFLSLLILPTSVILGIFNGFTVPNLIFGLFIELPIITGFLFHFARIHYNKEGHFFPLRVLAPFPFPSPTRVQDEYSITAVMTTMLLVPPFIAIGLYDWVASKTLLWPAHIWKLGFFVYIIALGSLFYVAHAFVESYLEQQSYAGVLGLTFLWILGASQYLLFNPVNATFGNVTMAFLIVFGFGLAMTFMGLFHRTLKKIFGKVVVVELVTATMISIWIIQNFMNIL